MGLVHLHADRRQDVPRAIPVHGPRRRQQPAHVDRARRCVLRISLSPRPTLTIGPGAVYFA